MDIGLSPAFGGGFLGVASIFGGAAIQVSGFSPQPGY
jgi:hypothetical protein